MLVGVDTASTFCYLLSLEEHRDADTWGVRVLELVDQGFAPKSIIADFGSGLRPDTRRLCLSVPAAVMFFMRCPMLVRWSVTWRTGPMKPSRSKSSSSGNKPPPNVGVAARIADQRLQAERDAAQAAQARAEAEAAQHAAQLQSQQDQLKAEQERQKALQAEAAAEQAEKEKEQLRAQLLEQFNRILPTTDTPRGLKVNMADVLFDFGKYDLKPPAREALAKMSGIVIAHPGLKLAVEGYTDSVGSDTFNLTLSQNRADTVRAYLVNQGLDPNTITATGYGKSNPVAPNDTAEGRQQNRRVEIIISGELIGERLGGPATPQQ